MITIAKQFTFDAAHQLCDMPEGHKCRRLHGHTYVVEIQLRGEPDANGILVDYAEIAEAWAPLYAELDHRYLNDIPGLAKPTTEVLVWWIFDRLVAAKFSPNLYAVRVSESATTWAEIHARDYAATARKGRP
jgi:6-pyruvoyltetrahydropterin/6-carboxytetrahydropterin synthase